MSARQPRVAAVAQPAHLGDVVACLPMAAALKRRWPGVRVLFIARQYTRQLVEACVNVDGFVDVEAVLADPGLLARLQVDLFLNPYLVDDLGLAARRAGVPLRVGNLRRLRTLKWANRFIFQGSRRNPRHMANVNLWHLRGAGIRLQCAPAELAQMLGVERLPPLPAELAARLDPQRFNLILHPKSNKNAREWPAAYFDRLADLLPPQRYKIFLSGRAAEREQLQRECPRLLQRPEVENLMGLLDLGQFIAFIGRADGMVCNSTGPLHIAGALGLHALGLYPGRSRASARKWGVLGVRAQSLSLRQDCEPGPGRCPFDYKGEECSCMTGIAPETVAAQVLNWTKR